MLIAAAMTLALGAFAPPASWQYQLQGRVDTTVRARFFSIDSEASASTVAALHRRGATVACYVNAGAWEAFRDDAGAFPPEVIGARYTGYPDERWLDIRRIDALAPILRARLDACRAKGFDAVDPDNVNGYENRTGFPLSGADQRRFNRWLADEVHARGMEVGLKNDGPQARALEPSFDFAIVEECLERGECGEYAPFIRAGKPVYAVEYRTPSKRACAEARRRKLSVVFKTPALRAPRRTCGRNVQAPRATLAR